MLKCPLGIKDGSRETKSARQELMMVWTKNVTVGRIRGSQVLNTF